MTLAELLQQTRIDLDDTEQDYLWSDAELKRHLNEGYNEAVRRARLIVDASTSAVCSIAVTAGTASYDLHSSIYRVLEVYGTWDASRPLRKFTTREMELHRRDWRTETGEPSGYILDFETGKLRLNTIPDTNGTLSLRVYRLPLEALSADSDVPVIRADLHEKLIHWVRYKAYLKPDSDTLNKQGSADALALFEQEFGPAKPVWSDEYENRNSVDDFMDGNY